MFKTTLAFKSSWSGKFTGGFTALYVSYKNMSWTHLEDSSCFVCEEARGHKGRRSVQRGHRNMRVEQASIRTPCFGMGRKVTATETWPLKNLPCELHRVQVKVSSSIAWYCVTYYLAKYYKQDPLKQQLMSGVQDGDGEIWIHVEFSSEEEEHQSSSYPWAAYYKKGLKQISISYINFASHSVSFL